MARISGRVSVAAGDVEGAGAVTVVVDRVAAVVVDGLTVDGEASAGGEAALDVDPAEVVPDVDPSEVVSAVPSDGADGEPEPGEPGTETSRGASEVGAGEVGAASGSTAATVTADAADTSSEGLGFAQAPARTPIERVRAAKPLGVTSPP